MDKIFTGDKKIVIGNVIYYIYSSKTNKAIIPTPSIIEINCNTEIDNLHSCWSSGIRSDPAIYIKPPAVIGSKIDE